MAGPIEEALKLLGLSTPFIYAAATYGFFHYLDKQASVKAKRAISGWLKPLDYDRAAVAAAVVELFDRLYTRPLLGWRAVLRSTLLTILLTAIFIFEFLNASAGTRETGSLSVWMATNIISDYISLFVVRKLLIVGANRPTIALVFGPLVGMSIVGFFSYIRTVVTVFVLLFAPLGLSFGELMAVAHLMIIQPVNVLPYFSLFWYLSAPALAVHLWLPMFGLGLLCLKGLNYFFGAIKAVQWFLKAGNQHPLDAVGYVLGAIVFVGTVAARLV